MVKERHYKFYLVNIFTAETFQTYYQICSHFDADIVRDTTEFRKVFHLILEAFCRELNFTEQDVLNALDHVSMETTLEFKSSSRLFTDLMKVFWHPFDELELEVPQVFHQPILFNWQLYHNKVEELDVTDVHQGDQEHIEQTVDPHQHIIDSRIYPRLDSTNQPLHLEHMHDTQLEDKLTPTKATAPELADIFDNEASFAGTNSRSYIGGLDINVYGFEYIERSKPSGPKYTRQFGSGQGSYNEQTSPSAGAASNNNQQSDSNRDKHGSNKKTQYNQNKDDNKDQIRK